MICSPASRYTASEPCLVYPTRKLTQLLLAYSSEAVQHGLLLHSYRLPTIYPYGPCNGHRKMPLPSTALQRSLGSSLFPSKFAETFHPRLASATWLGVEAVNFHFLRWPGTTGGPIVAEFVNRHIRNVSRLFLARGNY